MIKGFNGMLVLVILKPDDVKSIFCYDLLGFCDDKKRDGKVIRLFVIKKRDGVIGSGDRKALVVWFIIQKNDESVVGVRVFLTKRLEGVVRLWLSIIL
jgi:hypothetical protein